VKTATTVVCLALALAGALAQTNAPVSHEYAEVNGVRLHYARAGNGPLVVFLHGFPEFWYEWKHQLAEFGRDHLAVAPDMRGYNLSSKPEAVADYQMPQLVEDIRALTSGILKPTGGKTFALVGHDWGGVVAWVFAAQHPEMLDKLVIINAPHPTVFGRLLRGDAEQQQASQYMLMFRSPAAEATLSANGYDRLTSMVLGAGLRNGTVTEQDKQAYLAAWSQPGALTGGLNYYRASGVGPPPGAGRPSGASPPPSGVGPAPESGGGAPGVSPAAIGGGLATAGVAPAMTVRVPTLVIWGEKDTALLPSNLVGLDDVVPTLTIKRIPDGTHWVVRENAPEVNRLIREYLARP
jgi:pimeloyl-ACP methyl ester carboxylesterase